MFALVRWGSRRQPKNKATTPPGASRFFDMKRESIFKTPRRGLMGSKSLGADYMPEVKERARRMKAATCEEKQPADDRQQRLPGL